MVLRFPRNPHACALVITKVGRDGGSLCSIAVAAAEIAADADADVGRDFFRLVFLEVPFERVEVVERVELRERFGRFCLVRVALDERFDLSERAGLRLRRTFRLFVDADFRDDDDRRLPCVWFDFSHLTILSHEVDLPLMAIAASVWPCGSSYS